MTRLTDLRRRWATTMAGLAPDASPHTVAVQGDLLLSRWGEAHRRYHDVVHLAEVLDGVDALADDADDVDVVRAAAWFHDAVYAGRPGQDEAESARLARQVLARLGVDGARVDAVERLVLLTIDHDPQDGDADGAVLCDGDLAVLASGPERYGEYVSAVRAEYAHVPDEAFRAGRAAVLRSLLVHERLYRTRSGREQWEATARANLAREVAALEGAGLETDQAANGPWTSGAK